MVGANVRCYTPDVPPEFRDCAVTAIHAWTVGSSVSKLLILYWISFLLNRD